MLAGYHTAGLLLHDPIDAMVELAHLGYTAVVVRPHAAWLHPDRPFFGQQVLRLADTVRRTGVRLMMDLDASFLDDPFTQRGPSLASEDGDETATARQSIVSWVRVADEAGATLVTFSGGAGSVASTRSAEESLEQFSESLHRLIEATASAKPRLAIRPRVGDLIGSVAQFERLVQWLGDDAPHLGLAADVGQMLAGGELPVADRLHRNLDSLACVYLCDRRPGIGGDQPIGEGEVAIPRIIDSLRRSGYDGPGVIRVEGHPELGLGPARQAIGLFD